MSFRKPYQFPALLRKVWSHYVFDLESARIIKHGGRFFEIDVMLLVVLLGLLPVPENIIYVYTLIRTPRRTALECGHAYLSAEKNAGKMPALPNLARLQHEGLV
jgi:hypothetical protein